MVLAAAVAGFLTGTTFGVGSTRSGPGGTGYTGSGGAMSRHSESTGARSGIAASRWPTMSGAQMPSAVRSSVDHAGASGLGGEQILPRGGAHSRWWWWWRWRGGPRTCATTSHMATGPSGCILKCPTRLRWSSELAADMWLSTGEHGAGGRHSWTGAVFTSRSSTGARSGSCQGAVSRGGGCSGGASALSISKAGGGSDTPMMPSPAASAKQQLRSSSQPRSRLWRMPRAAEQMRERVWTSCGRSSWMRRDSAPASARAATTLGPGFAAAKAFSRWIIAVGSRES
mmetsp:Transcript_71639/g.221558  ORF Transcript_71639/g.221558 Transcript_71639/m.221558 type:complete len:285 (-) Transcript_71639:1408-2262(-)